MLKKYRGPLIGLVCLAAAITLIVLLGGGTQNFADKYADTDLTADVSGIGRSDTYNGYLLAHADAGIGAEPVTVDVLAFEGDAEQSQDDAGAPCVYTPDGSYVTWKVTVPQAGMYNILLDYLTVPSRGVDMEREL